MVARSSRRRDECRSNAGPVRCQLEATAIDILVQGVDRAVNSIQFSCRRDVVIVPRLDVQGVAGGSETASKTLPFANAQTITVVVQAIKGDSARAPHIFRATERPSHISQVRRTERRRRLFLQ